MDYSIGVDIGGTKVATGIIDRDANVLYRAEVPSFATDRESMFKQVVKSIDMVLKKSDLSIHNIKGMGVGIPGKVDQENGIAVFQNNLPWKNFPVADRLREHFHLERVSLDNDVYMATFAEWNAQGANQDETFVYLTISTGISCSIIHQGKFMRGAGFAGELGMLPVLSPASSESLVRLEQAASGPGIEKLMNDKRLKPKDIFERYQKNDPDAQEIVSSMVTSIAHGCYAICCLIDPHKIVFGGGVMNHHPYLIEKIKQEMETFLIPEQRMNMYVSQFKGDSGVVGAALRGF